MIESNATNDAQRALVSVLQRELSPTSRIRVEFGKGVHISAEIKGATKRWYADDARWLAYLITKADRLSQGDKAGPLARNLICNPIMETILLLHGGDVQDLIDRLWAGFPESGDQDPLHWSTSERSPSGAPGRKVQMPRDQHVVAPIADDLFLMGELDVWGLRIKVAACAERFVLRSQKNQTELTIPEMLPHTVAVSLRGRPLREVVSHPALDRHELTVGVAKTGNGYTTMTLVGDDATKGRTFRDVPRFREDAYLGLSPSEEALAVLQAIDRALDATRS